MAKFYDAQSVERAAKQEWDASASVREEFNENFESFVAFKKADARGAVKILRGEKSESSNV